MTGQLTRGPLVLGFHPTARGFGWTVFENPFALVAHGLYEAQGAEKNPRCLRKLTWLLTVYEPEILVIEAFDRESSLRSERIRQLCLAVVSAAAEHNAEVSCLKRSEVGRAFATIGAKTRDEIAQAVSHHLPALATRLPEPRKPWQAEDKRLSVFCAAALVIAYYHNGATALLNDLRNAA